MYLSEKEWATVEPYVTPAGEPGAKDILALMTDKDRELAKAIYKTKGYVGPLGMIERGIVLGRLLADLDNPAEVKAAMLCPRDGNSLKPNAQITLVECDPVLLNPSTARSFGNALLQAAAEAATETE